MSFFWKMTIFLQALVLLVFGIMWTIFTLFGDGFPLAEKWFN